jgi:hypothetical protein
MYWQRTVRNVVAVVLLLPERVPVVWAVLHDAVPSGQDSYLVFARHIKSNPARF